MTQARLIGNGRYRLLGPLGEGGMARVYRAEDEATGGLVAIKLLREPFASDPSIVERFRNEARAAAALQHPNIVQVVEVGDDDGTPYLALELVEGGDLRDRIREQGPLPITLVIEIGQQLCAALAVAHARGFIHRDVKPQNVLLARDADGEIQIKLTDFGIARALGATTQTRTGEILGSVHFLSPEQLRGRAATAQSDLYAVGCVLYEMLTGRPPFQADTDIAVAMQHLQEPPVPPGNLRPGTPRMLQDLILRCLSKEPGQRFGSAAELQEALRRVGSFSEQGTSVFAAPPPLRPATTPGTRGVPHRQAPPPPRRRRETTAGVAVNVVLLTGIGVFLLALAGAAFLVVTALGGGGNPLQPGAKAAAPTSVATAPPRPTAAATAKPQPKESPTPAPTPSQTPPPVHRVPALAGLTLEEARAALGPLGFQLKEGEARFDNQVDAGRIIQQSPEPETELATASDVTVIVSRGPSRVQVPQLTGTNVDAANQRAVDAGLLLEVEEVFNATIPAGAVFAQDPRPGGTVERGSTVSVQVSKGPEMVTVPNVVGLPEEEAKRRILATGKLKLWPFGTNYQGHDTLPDDVLRRVPVGAVLSTRPAAGAEVEPGTEVAIAVRKD